MFTCVENGLHTQGILQGSLQLKRVAGSIVSTGFKYTS